MYAGKLVETGSVDEIFYRPRMPYTLGLLGSLPRMDEARGARLTPIVGTPPSLLNLPPGCPFAPRCPIAKPTCREEEPALLPIDESGHSAACHFSAELEAARPGDLFRPIAVDADALQRVGGAVMTTPPVPAQTSPEGSQTEPVLQCAQPGQALPGAFEGADPAQDRRGPRGL